MSNKILGILIIIGAVVGLVILIGSNVNHQEETTERKSDSQVKEAQTQQTPVIKDITASEAQTLIQKNRQNKDLVSIDVRTPSEYTSGHIETAVNIDYSSTIFRDELAKLDKNKTYLIYCRSGARSKKALDIMKELGFNEVYNLTSGITGWTAEGLPVVK